MTLVTHVRYRTRQATEAIGYNRPDFKLPADALPIVHESIRLVGTLATDNLSGD